MDCDENGAGSLLKKEHCNYTSCYCEENVYWLCKKFTEEIMMKDFCHYVVVVSNPTKAVPIFQQQAGKEEHEGLVVWDYHVFVLQASTKFRDNSSSLIWDLDTKLGFPLPAEEYFDKSFPMELDEEEAIYFKVIDAQTYLRDFSSDRSHMKDEQGNWQSPPPQHPCIMSQDGISKFQRLLITKTELESGCHNMGVIYGFDEFCKKFLD
jgi:hypothetical protein